MRNRMHMSALGSALSLLLVFSVAAVGSPVASIASPVAAIASPVVAISSPIAEAPVADAAMAGDTETVRALLREGADVNAAQGDGMTALHWTALNADIETMTLLAYAGANMDPLTRLGAYTPLHLASAEGNGDAVAFLLGAGGNPSAMTATGVSSIHLAAQAGSPEAVASLLEHGVDVNVRDETHGRTPLIFSTSRNRLETMEVLLSAGADAYLATDIIDYVTRSNEDNAARSTRQRVADAAAGRTSSGRGRGAPSGQPPPQNQGQQAARGGRQAQAAQPDPADPDDPPGTPRRGRRGGRADPADPDDPPGTPRAGQPGATDPDNTAPDEPEPQPDPRAPRSLSNTEQIGQQGGFAPIHYASRDGFRDAAFMLLDAGTDIDLLTTGDSSSPMMVAIINGNYDLALEFLENGANVALSTDDGASPVFAALNQEWHLRTWYPQPTANEQQEASYLDLMRALLEAGADPNARTKSHIWYAAYNAGRMGVDFTGATAFWRAAYALDVDAMRLLVSYGADPNIATQKLPSRRSFFSLNQNFPAQADEPEEQTDPSGLPLVPTGGAHVSPLHAATGVGFGTSRVAQQHRHVPDGWLRAAMYLIEEVGIDVNVRDADGFSPLHNTAGRGDNEVVLYLIERGADPLVVSRRGHTTVDMANSAEQRTQPYPATIALLERFGAINNNNCRACD